jgi:nifR3 family TIM-barrel protein
VNGDRLPTLRLGPIQLDFPVVQAALSGYSDWPMRVIAKRYGAPYTLCEVLLDKFLIELKDRQRTRRFLWVSDEEHPVGGQLMGAVPEDFGPAALKLVEAGFDVIDLNFGCPVKKVLGRCRGGFLLSQPKTALEIISRVREAVPPHVPVTVKMRRALNDDPQSRDHFFEIFDGAYERGVAAITVHGRTVEQRYNGPSNWKLLREIKRHAGSRVVLGSGDLFTAEACLEMIRYTGVDGVTAARGAIGNPWIFQEARALAAGLPLPPPPTVHQQRDALREHFRLAMEVYDERRASIMLRKFGIKYAALHPEFEALREAFVSVSSLAEWNAVLDHWYRDDLPGVRRPITEDSPIIAETCELRDSDQLS